VDLIYAKRDLSNFLKRENEELIDFFVFATMELGTNLIKHANGGEIWILKEKNSFYLASLDKGPGIEDTKWCVQKGNTTYKNSLGLGLYSLSNHETYEFEIFSMLNRGSVFLLKPKRKINEIYLQLPYLNEKYLGDLIVKKDKFYLFGDISGHGKKAWESARFIKKFFLQKPLTLLDCDSFFSCLDKKLKEKNLRSAVLAVIEKLEKEINVCGVGNIVFFSKEENKFFNFKPGIVGEVFSKSSFFKFNKNDMLVFITDGVDKGILKEILTEPLSYEMIAICALFFSDKNDDKSILIIGEEL